MTSKIQITETLRGKGKKSDFACHNWNLRLNSSLNSNSSSLDLDLTWIVTIKLNLIEEDIDEPGECIDGMTHDQEASQTS